MATDEHTLLWTYAKRLWVFVTYKKELPPVQEPVIIPDTIVAAPEPVIEVAPDTTAVVETLRKWHTAARSCVLHTRMLANEKLMFLWRNVKIRKQLPLGDVYKRQAYQRIHIHGVCLF